MQASTSNFQMDVSTRHGCPDYPEARSALMAILSVGIDNILDKEMQPRKRHHKRVHARVDAQDTRILTPEEYSPQLLQHLGRLMRQCDDPAQIKLLLRQQVEKRQADGKIRARVRLGREVQPLDVKAVISDLNKQDRENGIPGIEVAAEDAPQRKRPAEPLTGLDDKEHSCAKQLRLDLPKQNGEQDGVGYVKQEEEQGDEQYIKQEEEQECGLRYVLEYAPGGHDVDQEDMKQEDIKHEEERSDDQNDDDPQDGEPSAQASKKSRRGTAHRAGKARKEQRERRERRVEYARRTADILSAHPRHDDALTKDFGSTTESSWILRLLQSQAHRLGDIKRLLASSEQDREPPAAKLAAHLAASSALSEATRTLDGKDKWKFLQHHVLDMEDDRTHLEHKAVVLKTSIRKLYEFTKEKNYRLRKNMEASVLEALT